MDDSSFNLETNSKLIEKTNLTFKNSEQSAISNKSFHKDVNDLAHDTELDNASFNDTTKAKKNDSIYLGNDPMNIRRENRDYQGSNTKNDAESAENKGSMKTEIGREFKPSTIQSDQEKTEKSVLKLEEPVILKKIISKQEKSAFNYLIKEKEFQPKHYLKDTQIDEEEMEEQNNFEVERIIGHRFNIERKLYFLVKWKGWPDIFNSWEPEVNFANFRIVLNEYIEKIGGNSDDYYDYFQTMIEFDNLADPDHTRERDLSSYVYVLDKKGYLATAENLLTNDFYMPSQTIRCAKPSTSMTMGSRSKTNFISVTGSVSVPESQSVSNAVKRETDSDQANQSKQSKLNMEQSRSSGQNSSDPASVFPEKSATESTLMPKFFNNMCEPEKDSIKLERTSNFATLREEPVRTKYFQLLKKNIGLNLKRRICEREQAQDPALFGSFKFGDVPLRILKIEVVTVLPKEVHLNCLVEWVNRKNGFKPKNSVYSNHILKQKSPLLLINYYESNIHIY